MKADLVAGLTTAVMLIPQAMAYALLAGLPPSAGLYASMAPLLAYAAVGSSRELAVGPVAMDSLLTAATVGLMAQTGTLHYVELAALLALMVGGIQIILGLLRGGFLVNFLSRPVISGFTSAAAIIIAVSQFKLILGLDIPRSPSVFVLLYEIIQKISETHILTTLLALFSMFGLWFMKKNYPHWPRALVIVVLGAAITHIFEFSSQGVAMVASVPAGLPFPKLPNLEMHHMTSLLPGALTIALVAFMESLSISTKMADKKKYRIYPNREFMALGLANSASGLFGGYPVAGGLSRTVVNAEAGATSQRAAVVTASVVALTLAFFSPLMQTVPKASLGAIIIMAIVGLIDIQEPKRLWAIKPNDGLVLLVTFIATLTLGIQTGILVGVGLSLLLLIIRTTQPHSAVLGYLPSENIYRNIDRFPEASTYPGILILRLDAQLYFGNISFLRDRLTQLEQDSSEPLKAVIIDAAGINQLDSSAEKALRDIYEDYKNREIRFILAGPIGPVRDVLDRSGLRADLGPKGMAWSVAHAIKFLNTPFKHGEPI